MTVDFVSWMLVGQSLAMRGYPATRTVTLPFIGVGPVLRYKRYIFSSAAGFTTLTGMQGYRGDGINCVPDVCQKVPAPCFKDVECYNIEKPPYYKCGVCPEGLTGNGTWCNDLDECDLADPCDVAATCYNLIPGFRFASIANSLVDKV